MKGIKLIDILNKELKGKEITLYNAIFSDGKSSLMYSNKKPAEGAIKYRQVTGIIQNFSNTRLEGGDGDECVFEYDGMQLSVKLKSGETVEVFLTSVEHKLLIQDK